MIRNLLAKNRHKYNIDSIQEVYAWGNNSNGQLGLQYNNQSDDDDEGDDDDDEDLDNDSIMLPTHVKFNGKGHMVKCIASGEYHTIFVLRNGSVYSCGSNEHGQCGLPQQDLSIAPERIESLENDQITSAYCGESHTILMTEKGILISFGLNKKGQLGIGKTQNQDIEKTPKYIQNFPKKTIVKAVACGKSHSMALTADGQVFSWGSNEFGQLGNGTLIDSEVPIPIMNLSNLPIWKISTGAYHSVSLTISGEVHTWGRNSSGQLGLGDLVDCKVPSYLQDLKSKPRHICCGEEHTVMLTDCHRVYTWGAGSSGQLGHGDFNNVLSPQIVSHLSKDNITQIACGRKHTLAYSLVTGSLYPFGLGVKGQLGLNSLQKHNIPDICDSVWNTPSWSRIKEKIDSTEDSMNCYFKNDVKNKLDEIMKSDNTTGGSVVIVKDIYAGGLQSYALVCNIKLSATLPSIYSLLSTDTLLVFNESLCEHIYEILKTSQNEEMDRVIDLVERVFSSPSCLNGSFLKRDEHEKLNEKALVGINISSARKFIETICTKNTKIVELLLSCVRDHLLPTLSSKAVHQSQLRVIILIPLFPFFSNMTYRWQVLLPYGNHILKLPQSTQRIIVGWWAQSSPRYLTRLVQSFKDCVLALLNETLPAHAGIMSRNSCKMMVERFENKRSIIQDVGVKVQIYSLHAALHTCMSILAKLFQMNEEAGFIISYQVFYLEELMKKIDMKGDFTNWLTNRDGFSFSKYPFALNAKVKSYLLELESQIQMKTMINETNMVNIAGLVGGMLDTPIDLFLRIRIRRDHIVEDTLNELLKHRPQEFKKPLKIQFNDEEAEDAGGVKKEFFLLLMKEILNPKYGMFTFYERTVAWFNASTLESPEMFLLIGIICGLAIYNSIIIDLPFPLCLYKKLLKKKVNLDDLRGIQLDLARNLQYMLDYEEDDFDDVFDMTFQTTEMFFDSLTTINLVPHGENIKVSKENREAYVEAFLDYKLNKCIEKPYEAFAEGFHRVCGGLVLNFFQPNELMEMVVGSQDFDLNELEKICKYEGEYYRHHPVIKNFWDVFHSFTLDMKKKFLTFLTGSNKISIMGIEEMKFIIQPVPGGEHGDHLPVAHTCFNLLDLPRYPTLEMMRIKLTQAIENYQGFGLV